MNKQVNWKTTSTRVDKPPGVGDTYSEMQYLCTSIQQLNLALSIFYYIADKNWMHAYFIRSFSYQALEKSGLLKNDTFFLIKGIWRVKRDGEMKR